MSPCLMLFLVGCGQESGTGNSDKGPRGGAGRLPRQDIKQCRSTQILDIARNGKIILSSISGKKNSSGIVSWDLRSKKIRAKYRFRLNFIKTSPNGEYFIKKLTRNKYQVLSFSDNSIDYNAILNTNSISEPSIDFSLDSKFVLINSTPIASNGMNQFDIFDIEKRRFVRSFRARGIKFMKMTKDSNYIVMGYDNGYEKFLAMYTLVNFEEVFKIKLPRYGNFTFLESAMNRIIIKSDQDYFVFNTSTGQKVFEGTYEFFYDVSTSGRYALVTRELGSFSILDTENGSLMYTQKVPDEVELSSCQLTDFPIQLVCKDKFNSGRVFVKDLESKESVSVCI